MHSTLLFKKRKHPNMERKYKRTGNNILAKKKRQRNLKPIGFASVILSGTEKKYAINEMEIIAVWGREHFRLYIYGKPIKLFTNHQAQKSLIKRNQSNKTYSARLTRWFDILAHFGVQIGVLQANISAQPNI